MTEARNIKIIRGLHNIPQSAQAGVLTIGNFDGVHQGHLFLIEQVAKRAKLDKSPAVLITFEPHPNEYFNKGKVTIPRLTRFREKMLAFKQYQIDYVLILPFNQKLAELSASDFIATIHRALRPNHLIIGDDFKFGAQRLGDFRLLKNSGIELGFTVEESQTALFEGERISSTRVRQALKTGALQLAKQLLGRPYSMLGRVQHGDKLGSQWGYPTANIHLHRPLTPVKGIFTVYVHGLGNKPLPGVANVGERPTINGTKTLLEVHLLDFNQQIYGREVRVEFCKKLREEIHFPSVPLLIEQITKDVAEAKAYFNSKGV